ncbi:MAG: quinone-dependent dihydroorotate dehydrogenase [Owenweeksia sp.]|nr:quinone-dependent dihydroorotate dehydrogenase [Owenweeksia sp.]
MYKWLIRPLFFTFSPEKIHHITFSLIRLMQALPGVKALVKATYNTTDPSLARQVMGLHFKNPLGLAAGFDKDAKAFEELANYGFGFIEVGTVTPVPQPGNPQPRLFRLPADRALINRMGFNNDGVEAMAKRLKRRKIRELIIGGNIGKNKDTPNEQALNDYLICFDALFPFVDYFVVNVSSPNTPNLRDLQEKEPLKKLLSQVQKENLERNRPKPILLKIAPDLTEGQLHDIVEIVQETDIAGVIATNTTTTREGLKTPEDQVKAIGTGGLSGAPVRERATEVVRFLRNEFGEGPVIIAVGGVFTTDHAREKLLAGADLVQVYTGFIYEGPGMVKKICRGLSAAASQG